MRFVLVHGSWHDGSLLEPTAEALRGLGNDVTTPTLAGHGPGADVDVNHNDLVRSLVDHLNDLEDVVLVGHSFGGTVIARAVADVPERIRRLVFWNGFVVRDGNSAVDEVPPPFREMFAGLAAASADNAFMLPYPIWREAFIGDADAELARSAYELLCPEPYQPLIDKLDLGAFYASQIPRSYLNCTEDIAMPPGEEWSWHPRFSNRLGLYRLVQMPGSHEVLFTNPAGAAQKLMEAGRD